VTLQEHLSESEIARALSLLHATLEASTDGVLSVDENGRILLYNQRFVDMWSLPPGVVATRDDDKAIDFALGQLKHPQAFLDRVRELYALPEESSYDMLELKDGRLFERYSRPQVVDGKTIARAWFFRDVTERVRSSQALAAQAEDLRRSNAELERFAYVASHDLQEPLRMVASYLELLEKRHGERLEQEALDYIGIAMDGAQRMRTLIQELLSYSRVGVGRELREQTDSGSLFDAACANLAATINETHATVSREALPEVKVVSSEIITLFQNLIANGIKFNREDTPYVHCSAERRDSEWLFTVRDHGIGIEAKDREKIFGLFQRLHGKDDYAGTGLGLAIAKKIVENHGGSIWVDDTFGRGTTFKFTLPAL
jgi:signal transduction histidine kinase